MCRPVPVGDRKLRHGTLCCGEPLRSLSLARRTDQGVRSNLVKPEAADVECQQTHQEDKDDAPAKGVGDQAQPEPAW